MHLGFLDFEVGHSLAHCASAFAQGPRQGLYCDRSGRGYLYNAKSTSEADMLCLLASEPQRHRPSDGFVIGA